MGDTFKCVVNQQTPRVSLAETIKPLSDDGLAMVVLEFTRKNNEIHREAMPLVLAKELAEAILDQIRIADQNGILDQEDF